MANPKIRVNIPTKPIELIRLAKKISVKHFADGINSPFKLMQNSDWDLVGPLTADCLKAHEDAEEMSRKTEALYRKRDAMLKQIDDTVKASRDLLLGIYRGGPKKLGEWGFEVDDSPRTPKAKS